MDLKSDPKQQEVHYESPKIKHYVKDKALFGLRNGKLWKNATYQYKVHD